METDHECTSEWPEADRDDRKLRECRDVARSGRVAAASRAGGHRADLLSVGDRRRSAGFSVNDSTVFLFEHEFGMPFPVLSAHLAALAENILPVLLVVGFATRLSALALFVMTIVIQIVAPQGFWTFHILWFAVLLYVVARGPGQVSVDHLIERAYRNRTA